MARARTYLDQARDLARDYTAGLNVREVRRLFDQDASRTYEVLAREQEGPPGRHVRLAGLRRVLHGAKVVFLGISYKLSPARRLLFALSLLAAVLGLVTESGLTVNVAVLSLRLDADVFWLLASVAGLSFLLALELVDRIRVRDELEVARQLQRELLPSESPEIPGYDFAHSYRTANEVGGDYYQFTPLVDGRLAVLVGDASGHGIAAGLLMAIANATLKTALQIDPSPRRVAALLNSTLFRTGDRRAFMTLFCALLTPETGELEYVCAGHPFPLQRRADGTVVELGQGSLPLGIREEVTVFEGKARLRAGELLVVFTDGLPEAVGGESGEAFGFDRLTELLAAPGPARGIHDRLIVGFERHVGSSQLFDDTTLVVIERLA